MTQKGCDGWRGLMLALVLGMHGACASVADDAVEVSSTDQALCSGVKLSMNAANPITLGAAVTFTASGATCAASEVSEYRFAVARDGVPGEAQLQAFGSSSQVSWDTSGLASGRYTVVVYARHAGSKSNGQSTANVAVLVGNVCTSAALSVTPASPGVPGTAVTLLGNASCVGSAPEYRVSAKAPGATRFSELRGWGGSSYAWDTTGLSGGTYTIKYDVRASGNTSLSEVSRSLSYVLSESCGSLTLAANPAANATVGAPVALSATAACTGAGSPEYRFAYRPWGGSWNVFRDWGAEAATWNTAGLSSQDYTLRVETRALGATSVQAAKILSYTLGGRCSAVALAATPKSGPNTPQAVGVNVELTGTATCDADTSAEYRFVSRAPGAAELVELCGWGSSNRCAWSTAGLLEGKHTLAVEVRSAGYLGAAQATSSLTYGLGDVCQLQTATLSPAPPQSMGTQFALQASSSCAFAGVAEYRYSWRDVGASAWTMFRDWGAAGATLASAGQAVGAKEVLVEVRGADNAGTDGTRRLSYALIEACVPGSELDGSGGCAVCPEGTFGAGGLAACEPCPDGTFATSGSSACEPWTHCDDGEYVLAGGSAAADRRCEPCAEGTSSEGPNAARCMEYTLVRTGSGHTCGLRAGTGVAFCWGLNSSGQSEPPSGVAFVDLALGQQHSCGLRQDGTIQCWGYLEQVSGTPKGVVFTQVSAGTDHTCGVRADTGAARCWGDNTGGQASAPSGVAFTQLAAGAYHTCGVRADTGAIQCWGAQYATGAPTGTFSQISAGWDHTCAMRADGETIACWGLDRAGQIGGRPAGVIFTQVDAGQEFTCGLQRDTGTVHCWGRDAAGTLSGQPNTRTYAEIAAGGFHACGLRADSAEIECWGDDRSGQTRGTPRGVEFTHVAAGAESSCGVRADTGAPQCWGDDSAGQASGAPTDVALNEVVIGASHACGLRQDTGAITCWGELGGLQGLPSDVAFTDLASSSYHVCGVRADTAAIQCWGGDSHGESSGAPSDVPFTQVATGYDFTCGLRADTGTTVCWGDDSYGQVSSAPAGVAFTTIASGERHTCGVRADTHEIVCWGGNNSGQVSDVPSGRFTQVVGGTRFSCGLRDDGTMTCWGFYRWNPRR